MHTHVKQIQLLVIQMKRVGVELFLKRTQFFLLGCFFALSSVVIQLMTLCQSMAICHLSMSAASNVFSYLNLTNNRLSGVNKDTPIYHHYLTKKIK